MAKRGPKPLKSSYIINLDEIAFKIALAESPNSGTEVDVVIPVYYNGDDFLNRAMFLMEKRIYQSSFDDGEDALLCSTMRRNFRFLDVFPAKEKRANYTPGETDNGFVYYYKIRKEPNSAFRR